MFFHLSMSFETTSSVRIAIASVSRKAQIPYMSYVIAECAVRRSRSELLCAGGTVPYQSQIQDCQSKSQHGPRISRLPSHDKCICCVLGFGLQEHLEDTSWPFNFSLLAVPSVCKMRLKLIIIKQERNKHGKKRKCVCTLWGVFNICLGPNRITSDIKSNSTIVSLWQPFNNLPCWWKKC